jgi:hypothetical protein
MCQCLVNVFSINLYVRRIDTRVCYVSTIILFVCGIKFVVLSFVGSGVEC